MTMESKYSLWHVHESTATFLPHCNSCLPYECPSDKRWESIVFARNLHNITQVFEVLVTTWARIFSLVDAFPWLRHQLTPPSLHTLVVYAGRVYSTHARLVFV